jgi:hypothetical protein
MDSEETLTDLKERAHARERALKGIFITLSKEGEGEKAKTRKRLHFLLSLRPPRHRALSEGLIAQNVHRPFCEFCVKAEKKGSAVSPLPQIITEDADHEDIDLNLPHTVGRYWY